jgi:cobalt/nickel transport protein
MRKDVMLWAGVLLLVLLPLIGLAPRDAEFEGADAEATALIESLAPDYEPWFEPWFEPPSGEIESLLFALQAALGAGLIGYYLGRRRSG